MLKKVALVSCNYDLISTFRKLYAPFCKVLVCADIVELHVLYLSVTPDYVLVDMVFLSQVRSASDVLPEKKECKPYFVASSAAEMRKSAAAFCPVLLFPQDIPLIFGDKRNGKKKLSEREEDVLSSFVGESSAVQKVRSQIYQAAKSTVPVLITGETGVGKGVTASLIHQLSSRGGRIMEKMNVTTIPETLAEAHLFGTEKGAFTDAVTREGYFERASGTSLFLDEIGELNHSLQAKLLHVLETGSFLRVGGTERKHSDARLIFATNADLKLRISRHEFRSDLYYRISRFRIHIPPLRERKADIIPVARHFLRASGKRLTAAAETLLTTFDWPGNVRQLEHCLERAAIASEDELIDLRHITVD